MCGIVVLLFYVVFTMEMHTLKSDTQEKPLFFLMEEGPGEGVSHVLNVIIPSRTSEEEERKVMMAALPGRC
jgi:hypothetical protein